MSFHCFRINRRASRLIAVGSIISIRRGNETGSFAKRIDPLFIGAYEIDGLRPHESLGQRKTFELIVIDNGECPKF